MRDETSGLPEFLSGKQLTNGFGKLRRSCEESDIGNREMSDHLQPTNLSGSVPNVFIGVNLNVDSPGFQPIGNDARVTDDGVPEFPARSLGKISLIWMREDQARGFVNPANLNRHSNPFLDFVGCGWRGSA